METSLDKWALFVYEHFDNTCNSIQVYPIVLVNSLAQIEDASLPERVEHSRPLQGSKRLNLVFGSNDKIYTHSF